MVGDGQQVAYHGKGAISFLVPEGRGPIVRLGIDGNFRFPQNLPGKMALLAFEFQGRVAGDYGLSVPAKTSFFSNARTRKGALDGSKIMRVKIQAIHSPRRVGGMKTERRGEDGGFYGARIPSSEQILEFHTLWRLPLRINLSALIFSHASGRFPALALGNASTYRLLLAPSHFMAFLMRPNYLVSRLPHPSETRNPFFVGGKLEWPASCPISRRGFK